MKRSEIRKTIEDVFDLTTSVDSSIEIGNNKTGDRYALEMPTTFAVIRGVLAWCDGLLEHDATVSSAKKQLKELLSMVGSSTVLMLASNEEE